MLTCLRYDDSRQKEWDSLAAGYGSIFHTAAFRRLLLDAFGYRCAYRAVVDGSGRVRALLPLVAGRNLAGRLAGVSLPFVNHADLCADSDEARDFALAAIPRICADEGLAYIELRLRDQDIAGPGWQRRLDNHTFVLPLTGGEDAVLALSTAGNRNHIRKAYKNDWFSVSFDPNHLAAFHAVYRQRMRQLGSPAPAIRFFQRFFACLPDNAHLLSVLDRASGRVIGGMLLLASPADATLYYPYGASLVDYNGRYLNNFMYWEAVRLGLRLGLANLDLGRSPAGSGTYRYKAQWGADARQLKYLTYGAAGGPPARENLGLAVELWKRTPAFITDNLGPILIKYVMP